MESLTTLISHINYYGRCLYYDGHKRRVSPGYPILLCFYSLNMFSSVMYKARKTKTLSCWSMDVSWDTGKNRFQRLNKTPFNTLNACLSLYCNKTICVFRLKTKVYTSVNLPHQGLWRKINGFNSRGQRSWRSTDASLAKSVSISKSKQSSFNTRDVVNVVFWPIQIPVFFSFLFFVFVFW